jgi:hypothetical protein
MSKAAGFHVRHDLQPGFTYELLALLKRQSQQVTEGDLQQAAQEQGFSLRQRKNYDKLLKSLEELGIIHKSRKWVSLTDRGSLIAEATIFQRHLLGELIHFLYYTAYDHDATYRVSWSYRTVCKHLWMTAPCTIDRDRLVNIVTQNASDEFELDSISFSTQSVMGVLHWVGSLQPACLDETTKLFSRRLYCPVETFAMVLNHVYNLRRGESLSLLLTPEIKREICQICLIVPEAFSEMLEQAEDTFETIHVRRERGERLVVRNFTWDFLKE